MWYTTRLRKHRTQHERRKRRSRLRRLLLFNNIVKHTYQPVRCHFPPHVKCIRSWRPWCALPTLAKPNMQSHAAAQQNAQVSHSAKKRTRGRKNDAWSSLVASSRQTKKKKTHNLTAAQGVRTSPFWERFWREQLSVLCKTKTRAQQDSTNTRRKPTPKHLSSSHTTLREEEKKIDKFYVWKQIRKERTESHSSHNI